MAFVSLTLQQSSEDEYGEDTPSARPIKLWDRKKQDEEQQKLEQKKKELADRTTTNLCLWKRVHSFVEGFPEQGVFYTLPDVAYAYISSLKSLGFPYTELQEK